MKPPKQFVIWGNTEKEAFWETLPGIMSWADRHDLDVYFTTRIEDRLPKGNKFPHQVLNSADEFVSMDFVLALGGDGTILSSARAVGPRKTPVLGIHLGDLGFMAKVTLADLYNRLDQVARGEYTLENRLVLQTEVHMGKNSETYSALNDVVIDKGTSHRMLTCQLSANDQFVANYKADGIIIATPTGSTAYSLAAGGPVIAPAVRSLVVTPICPHTLTSRPLVIPADTDLRITFPVEADDIALTVDGQVHVQLQKDSMVRVTEADYQLALITFKDDNYFRTLQTKMDWGKRGSV